MNGITQQFCVDLADLLEMYGANISYTTDDDGIWIEIDGERVNFDKWCDEYYRDAPEHPI